RAGRPARKLVIAAGVRADARLSEILAVAETRALLVETVQRQRLDDIAHTEHHQGVAGYFHARPPLSVQQLVERARTPALLLVLDGIQDPQNLGAIARTAEATGADGIVLSRHRSAAVTPAAAKAAAGATEHVPVAVAGNLAQALQVLEDAGVWRVGLDAAAEQRYDSFDYTVPVALVVGGEGAGLHDLTRRRCDALVRIPMLGRVASLNAGASAAVLLYEVLSQRGFAR
ncbi:MAG: 23S rRNA (guanosine(2251)-2'-O)-methyltransferase RlmB, partial [Candidatus Dormibacteraeota bacterium]|nr:23S rRNA (guanosine(2251)-2'-O)-methyltransferase RlmB [Candidatus Dormibacteraeota bacterium]